jgi:hypothetical protein
MYQPVPSMDDQPTPRVWQSPELPKPTIDTATLDAPFSSGSVPDSMSNVQEIPTPQQGINPWPVSNNNWMPANNVGPGVAVPYSWGGPQIQPVPQPPSASYPQVNLNICTVSALSRCCVAPDRNQT